MAPPYPAHLVTTWQLPNGVDVVIRPIRPEDGEVLKTNQRMLKLATSLGFKVAAHPEDDSATKATPM